MKALGIVLMSLGGLWAFGGIYNIAASWDSARTEFTAFAMLLNGIIYIVPSAVLLGVGAILYSVGRRRARASGTPALGSVGDGRLVPCRTCGHSVATDAPTCPQCGAPEPAGQVPALTLPSKRLTTPLPAPRSKRGLDMKALALALVVSIAGVVVAVIHSGLGVSAPGHSTSSPNVRAPQLLIRVERSSYEHGYLKLVSVMQNTGTEGVFSPTIRVEVSDDASTVLANDTAWPAGQLFKTMEPGTSAAFGTFSRVPGEPSNIKYRVSVDKYPHKVKLPSGR